MTIWVVGKVDFKIKNRTRHKEGHFISTIRRIHQKDITIKNINIPNNKTSKYKTLSILSITTTYPIFLNSLHQNFSKQDHSDLRAAKSTDQFSVSSYLTYHFFTLETFFLFRPQGFHPLSSLLKFIPFPVRKYIRQEMGCRKAVAVIHSLAIPFCFPFLVSDSIY